MLATLFWIGNTKKCIFWLLTNFFNFHYSQKIWFFLNDLHFLFSFSFKDISKWAWYIAFHSIIYVCFLVLYMVHCKKRRNCFIHYITYNIWNIIKYYILPLSTFIFFMLSFHICKINLTVVHLKMGKSFISEVWIHICIRFVKSNCDLKLVMVKKIHN